MSRSKLLALIIFTVIICIIAINFGVFSKTKYENILVNEDEWNEIISSRSETAIDIVYISFNDNELFKDNKNIYYYSVVEEEKRAYDPIIKYKAYGNLKLAIKDYITDDLIEQNKPLELLFYTNDGYAIVDVYVTTLPLLSIVYDTTDITVKFKDSNLFKYRNINNDTAIDKINKIRNHKDYVSYDVASKDLNEDQSMNIKLFDNRSNIQNRLITSDGIFRYRGASTLWYPKKGYRINLKDADINNNLSLLGMREDDDYLLYAGYNDAEKIRNVFSSKLWYECCGNDNSYNINNGMEYKYVELFINGSYEGLYALGYPVDEKTVDLQVNEYMFKKYNWDESEKSTLEDVHDMLGYELVSNSRNIAYDYLFNYYKKILGANKTNYNDIYNYIDIDNAIDIFLFYNLIQGTDHINGNGALKNTYITIKDDGRVLYTPWDMDITFGNAWEANSDVFTIDYYYGPNYNVIFKLSPIYKLIELKDSNINKLIYQKYKSLRETTWSDINIMKIIDAYENDIFNSGAYQRDMERWPDGSYENPSLKLSKFKSYVIERLEYMDEYMEKYN